MPFPFQPALFLADVFFSLLFVVHFSPFSALVSCLTSNISSFCSGLPFLLLIGLSRLLETRPTFCFSVALKLQVRLRVLTNDG
jgi:hypothetical protein